jgi:hypothetical protein
MEQKYGKKAEGAVRGRRWLKDSQNFIDPPGILIPATVVCRL